MLYIFYVIFYNFIFVFRWFDVEGFGIWGCLIVFFFFNEEILKKEEKYIMW